MDDDKYVVDDNILIGTKSGILSSSWPSELTCIHADHHHHHQSSSPSPPHSLELWARSTHVVISSHDMITRIFPPTFLRRVRHHRLCEKLDFPNWIKLTKSSSLHDTLESGVGLVVCWLFKTSSSSYNGVETGSLICPTSKQSKAGWDRH